MALQETQPRSAGRPLPNPAALVIALVTGLAAGIALFGWDRGLAALFGSANDTRLTFLAEAAVALAFGLHRPAPTARRAGMWIALAGALSVVVCVAPRGAGATLSWVLGDSLDAGMAMTAFGRLLVGGLLIVPAAYGAGASLRWLVAALPPIAPALMAIGTAIAALGAQWLGGAGGVSVWLVSGGVLALGAAAWMAASGASAAKFEPLGSGGRAWLSAPFLAGAAVTATAVGFAGLAERSLAAAIGNDLPGVGIGWTLTLAGGAVGVALGAAVGRRLTGATAIAITQLLIAATSAAVLLIVGRYDLLPAAYAERVVGATDFATIESAARALFLPRSGAIGLAAGLAAGLLAGAVPIGAAARSTWVARTTLGGAAGIVLGTVSWRWWIAALEIEGVLPVVAGLGTVFATLAVLRTPLRLPIRAALLLAGPIILGVAIARAPTPDRARLRVESTLRSSASLYLRAQRSWLAFDEDGARLSAAIMRRGHQRRLLVNGRFELSGASRGKSQGVLAHLPLALHGPAARALVVGAGNGWTVGSVRAHPVDRIDVYESSRTLVNAVAGFGPGAQRAISAEHVKMHIGDPMDLLTRATPYDVILLQPSGAWTRRSADAATVEFLSLANERLTAQGLLAHWIPGNSLTKSGIQILLATYCSVFPRVEVWAGEGADLVLLAKKSTAPHDFSAVLAAYRNVVVSRAVEASQIATPTTLLSQLLLDDAGTRRICAGRDVHSARNDLLGRGEAARRLAEPTVDPISGLAALRADVVSLFVNTPPDGFRAAVSQAVRARDLERTAMDLEQAELQFDAVAAYREALELNPDDGSIRRAFATLRSQMGINFVGEQALTAGHGYLREAVEIDTTYADGFANLGRLMMQMGDYDYAISVLGRATELEPDNDLFQEALGNVWKARGYFDKALPWYKRAMDINPINVDAAIGYIDSKLGMEGEHADLRGGLEFLERYVPIEPNHNGLLDRIGRLRGALRNPDEAP